MGDPTLDLHPALLPPPADPHERNHFVAGGDHPLRLVAEVAEHVARIVPELTYALMSTVRRAPRSRHDPGMPGDLGVEGRDRLLEVAPVERLVAAKQCHDDLLLQRLQ